MPLDFDYIEVEMRKFFDLTLSFDNIGFVTRKISRRLKSDAKCCHLQDKTNLHLDNHLSFVATTRHYDIRTHKSLLGPHDHIRSLTQTDRKGNRSLQSGSSHN